jgi:hypothetical protein
VTNDTLTAWIRGLAAASPRSHLVVLLRAEVGGFSGIRCPGATSVRLAFARDRDRKRPAASIRGPVARWRSPGGDAGRGGALVPRRRRRCPPARDETILR